jgi:hypothetical protein
MPSGSQTETTFCVIVWRVTHVPTAHGDVLEHSGWHAPHEDDSPGQSGWLTHLKPGAQLSASQSVTHNPCTSGLERRVNGGM